MAIQQETELYAPVKHFFATRGYDVKAEVAHCDLVAIHPDTGEMLIVELKKTFTLALLMQGAARQRLCPRVMLAVERNRKKSGAHNQRFGELAELCRRLGLGLMTVAFFKTKPPLIEVLCEPGDPPLHNARPARRARLVQEFHARSGDYNTGGSAGRKLVTAYREQALRCAWALQQQGRLAPREVAALTGCSRAQKLLRSNYYGWYAREARGIYSLTTAGEAALREYADVLATWPKPQEPANPQA